MRIWFDRTDNNSSVENAFSAQDFIYFLLVRKNIVIFLFCFLPWVQQQQRKKKKQNGF